MNTVLPSIIPHTKEQIIEEIARVKSFAPLVQVDISDGLFVPVASWPYNGRDAEFFEKLTDEEEGWPYWQEVDIEVHLMVRSPEEVLEKWIRSGAVSIVAHIEATENFQKIIDLCREHTVAVGVAIKPATDISRIAPFAEQVDFIQVMGSDTLGKHGVHLEESALIHIRKLHAMYPERIIGIDIGVTLDTAPDLVLAGATRLIAGSVLLESDNPEETYNEFKM